MANLINDIPMKSSYTSLTFKSAIFRNSLKSRQINGLFFSLGRCFKIGQSGHTAEQSLPTYLYQRTQLQI